MVITEEAIQVDRTPSNTPPRRPSRRLFGIGTAIVVVAAVASVAVVESSGPTRSDQTPEPAPRTRDDIVRDLVDAESSPPPPSTTEPRSPAQRWHRHHGPATTSSATSSTAGSSRRPPSTTEPRSPARRSPGTATRDDIVRDLVARGVVPAATLDDGTQITSPALGAVIARVVTALSRDLSCMVQTQATL